MPAEHRSTVHGTRDVEREWARLIDELAQRGVLGVPGAADALLRRGAAMRGQADSAADAPPGW